MKSKEEILAMKKQAYEKHSTAMQLDVEVNKEQGQWQFDEHVAPVFDEHVRASVPMYDSFHKLITTLSTHFVEESSNVFDLGTSTGEALKNIYNANRLKENVRYVGFDNSTAMLEECRKLQPSKAFEFYYQDLTEEDFTMQNASFITSVLMMQFIPIQKRLSVMQKAHDGLNEGGAFVIIEKVMANDTFLDLVFTTEYDYFKHSMGLSPEHIYQKRQSLKGVMRPITEDRNRELLKEAGFRKIETFFRHMNFVGIIAIK